MFDIAVRLKYFSIAAVADNMSCWHLVILFTEWENSPLNSCFGSVIYRGGGTEMWLGGLVREGSKQPTICTKCPRAKVKNWGD